MSDWFHLPYYLGVRGGNEILKYDDGFALRSSTTGWPDNLWMSTYETPVCDLISQYDFATGRVLCTGLGLGIIALLVASKPEVSEVVVIEYDKDVVDLFMQQGFDCSKLNIKVADALTYTDELKFDTIIMDHYNELGDVLILDIKMMIDVICENTKSPDAKVIPYRWIEFIDEYGSSSLGWGKKMKLPSMTVLEEYRYMTAASNPEVHSVVSVLLKEIHNNRGKSPE